MSPAKVSAAAALTVLTLGSSGALALPVTLQGGAGGASLVALGSGESLVGTRDLDLEPGDGFQMTISGSVRAEFTDSDRRFGNAWVILQSNAVAPAELRYSLTFSYRINGRGENWGSGEAYLDYLTQYYTDGTPGTPLPVPSQSVFDQRYEDSFRVNTGNTITAVGVLPAGGVLYVEALQDLFAYTRENWAGPDSYYLASGTATTVLTFRVLGSADVPLPAGAILLSSALLGGFGWAGYRRWGTDRVG